MIREMSLQTERMLYKKIANIIEQNKDEFSSGEIAEIIISVLKKELS
jgi:hypothetical protein